MTGILDVVKISRQEEARSRKYALLFFNDFESYYAYGVLHRQHCALGHYTILTSESDVKKTIFKREAGIAICDLFSLKGSIRYIVGFWLVEMSISTNQKPTIYRNLYENTAPVSCSRAESSSAEKWCARDSKPRALQWSRIENMEPN